MCPNDHSYKSKCVHLSVYQCCDVLFCSVILHGMWLLLDFISYTHELHMLSQDGLKDQCAGFMGLI